MRSDRHLCFFCYIFQMSHFVHMCYKEDMTIRIVPLFRGNLLQGYSSDSYVTSMDVIYLCGWIDKCHWNVEISQHPVGLTLVLWHNKKTYPFPKTKMTDEADGKNTVALLQLNFIYMTLYFSKCRTARNFCYFDETQKSCNYLMICLQNCFICFCFPLNM